MPKQKQLLLAPVRLMAPVGKEVVLVTGLCGKRNEFLTCQPIEWTLTPDSVGYFIQADNEHKRLKNIFHQASNKRDGSYAVTKSSSKAKVLTRGTPDTADDVAVLRGQSWVSVTSPTEGSTHVAVIAPGAENWDKRRQTATIYWVDVQWVLPAPAVIAAADSHRVTTTIRRASGKPQSGWIVRYEIINANVTSFAADQRSVLDAISDANGLASVNLVPANRSGSTQIRIKIIRPVNPDDDLPQMVVGQGFTSVTWNAPDPKVTLYGPESAGLGATITYRAEISNAGDMMARQVVATTSIPPNMTFVRSNPPARVMGNTLSWQLGDLAPRTARNLSIVCRPERNGNVRFCVKAESADRAQGRPLTAEACVETRVFSSALSLTMRGPETAEVGQQITFDIELKNTGYETLNNIVIRDRLPAGLAHPTETGSLIERVLKEPLMAGTTRKVPVKLTVKRAGQLCHTVEVFAQGGHSASASVCVNATEPPPPPAPEPKPSIEVTIDGPERGQVGDQLTFKFRFTNTGNVPLTKIRIVSTREISMYPRAASRGFDVDALARGEIIWNHWQLLPGEWIDREAKYECMKESASAWCRLFVESAEGVRSVKETVTQIAPSSRKPVGPTEPPPRIEEPTNETGAEPRQIIGDLKVSVGDRQDPIQIDGTTTYIVVIENGRNVSDKNVTLSLLLPPGLEFVKINGPVGARGISPDGRTVEVTQIKEMRPHETLNPFYIEVRGRKIGKHVIKARVKSFRSPQGVEADTDTTVNVSG